MFGDLPFDIQEKIFNLCLSNGDIDELEQQIEKIEKLISIVEINKPDIISFKRLQSKYDMIQCEPMYYLKHEYIERLEEDEEDFEEEFFIDFIVERQENLHELFREEKAYILSLFELHSI